MWPQTAPPRPPLCRPITLPLLVRLSGSALNDTPRWACLPLCCCCCGDGVNKPPLLTCLGAPSSKRPISGSGGALFDAASERDDCVADTLRAATDGPAGAFLLTPNRLRRALAGSSQDRCAWTPPIELASVLPVLMRALTLKSLPGWSGVKLGCACCDCAKPRPATGRAGGAIERGTLPDVLRMLELISLCSLMLL